MTQVPEPPILSTALNTAHPDNQKESSEEMLAAETIHFHDLSPAIEFACWVVVALAPLLRWVNGAAVTDDQFVVQVALVATALMGAIGLRIYNWRAGQSQRE